MRFFLPGETEKRCPDDVALHEAVEDEEWDFITFQQCSPLSGIGESFFPYLSELAEYCRMVSPKAELVLHQTWAYAANITNKAFENYSRNQDEMYASIVGAYRLASINSGIEIIIPSGKAWQFARQSLIGDNLTCEDGYHGNDYGCYLAGACFYEILTGRNVADNCFDLPGKSDAVCNLLKTCAHLACEEGIF